MIRLHRIHDSPGTHSRRLARVHSSSGGAVLAPLTGEGRARASRGRGFLVMFMAYGVLALTRVAGGDLQVTLETLSHGRVQLEVRSDQGRSFRAELAAQLPDWRPYLDAVTHPDDAFRIEIPTNGLHRVFVRVTEIGEEDSRMQPMIWIPGGTFMMGQEGDYAGAMGLPVAGPVHEVTLSPFRMDAYEVTLAEWVAVRDWAVDVSRGTRRYDFNTTGDAPGPDHPVTHVDWYDAVKWANARSEMHGLDPVYFTDATRARVFRAGAIALGNQAVDWDGSGYRLPTEAEWEYASRGGLSRKVFPWGDSYPEVTQANFKFDYGGTTRVGAFPPNHYGLFDMAGNVREWCWDLHKDDPSVHYTNHIVFAPYDPEPQTNPRGPDSGPRGMSRGGSWLDTQHFIQCGRRHNDERGRVTSFTGFRLVTRLREP
jgi:formylglycine-generating enzyme required for sulfatase activity